MKSIEITTAKRSLSDYAKELGDEMIVLTENNKPVAVLVSLKDTDIDSLALSTDPEFREVIERSREDFAAGRKLSLDDMRREVLP